MILVDASAVVAMLFGDPSAGLLMQRLADDPRRLLSLDSYLEAGLLLASRRRTDRLQAIADLDAFLAAAEISLEPADPRQARRALRARILAELGDNAPAAADDAGPAPRLVAPPLRFRRPPPA
jgi:uncharacterized protein with PIN domain